jgi:hypothetical protein
VRSPFASIRGTIFYGRRSSKDCHGRFLTWLVGREATLLVLLVLFRWRHGSETRSNTSSSCNGGHGYHESGPPATNSCGGELLNRGSTRRYEPIHVEGWEGPKYDNTSFQKCKTNVLSPTGRQDRDGVGIKRICWSGSQILPNCKVIPAVVGRTHTNHRHHRPTPCGVWFGEGEPADTVGRRTPARPSPGTHTPHPRYVPGMYGYSNTWYTGYLMK